MGLLDPEISDGFAGMLEACIDDAFASPAIADGESGISGEKV
jgi:hypothetical protein